jgi:hypothetical protein
MFEPSGFNAPLFPSVALGDTGVCGVVEQAAAASALATNNPQTILRTIKKSPEKNSKAPGKGNPGGEARHTL